MRHNTCVLLAAAVGWCCAAAMCSAAGPSYGIAAVAGNVEVVAAPGSVRRQVFESDAAVRIFWERELTADSLQVNARLPGVYNAYADFTDDVVNPGGNVRSYFLHFDGVGTSLVQLAGSVTFEGEIVGVIGRSLTLEETDGSLGAPGTLYPTDRFNREPEYWNRGTYDFFEIGADRRTLSFRWEVTTDIDQLRVVTLVPEPAAIGLLAVGGVVVAARRRVRADNNS